MIERLGLDPVRSLVMEIASNDGYLLQHFVRVGIPVLGVEPARNVAAVANGRGIRTETCFFGASSSQKLISQYGRPSLIVANNVIAHVPDLHDFVEGVRNSLAPDGTATFEFPHVMRLIEQTQFDTIYHEHYSYFALAPLIRVFREHALEVVDVEQLPTHGGSLRVFAMHAGVMAARRSVEALLEIERGHGLDHLTEYERFQQKVDECKTALLDFIAHARIAGRVVVGYGAPAKGNTLLNYCGLDSSAITYTVDRSPHKQGLLLPGSHIPIFQPERIYETKPDVLLILPWNLTTEVMEQMNGVRRWGGRFAIAIPRISLIE